MLSARALMFLAFAGALVGGPARAQAPTDAAAAAQRLRRFYFQRDYESGYAEAPALVRRFPRSTELRAWAIANEAETRRQLEALAAVDSLARMAPADRWTEFARAVVLERDYARLAEGALAPSARARATAPWDPDMVWLRAQVLSANRRYRPMLALIDSAAAHHAVTPPLLLVRGTYEVGLANRHDTTALPRALATAAEMLRLDSLDAMGWVLRGSVRGGQGDSQGRYDDVRRALALDSLSAFVRESFWYAAESRRGATQEEVRREVSADIETFLRARSRSTAALATAASAYAGLGLAERRDSLQAEIVARDPDGVEAEALAIRRIGRLRSMLWLKQVPDTAGAHAELRQLLRAFVARPRHHDTDALAAAYAYRFEDAIADTTVSASELVRAVEGLERYAPGEVSAIHVDAPLALADRRIALPYAERLARGARDALVKDIVARQEELPPEMLQSMLEGAGPASHDALGWVYFAEGKLPEARRELTQALESASRHARALYHLGRVEEAAGNLAAAENLYARGYAAERDQQDHPSEAALKRLYAARPGGAADYAAYVAKLQEQARAEQRAAVLARRVKPPRPLPPFKLARLGGGTVSSDTLRGRVGVLNFWGTWCPPCLVELPQIEQLYARFRSDPDVVFLTVDTNEPESAVAAFMARRNLTFPVLLDDAYAARAFVTGFPTTWFVGRDGRIAYEAQAGPADAMVDEFVWRIEALKAPAPALKAAPKP